MTTVAPTDTVQVPIEQQDDIKITFESYLRTLEQIPLPLNHNPLGHLPALSENYDPRGFEKFKHASASKPLGILFNEKNIVTLIDCSIGDWGLVPFITTYDRQGNKIDFLGPYRKSGEDMGYKAIEYMTINKDKTILIIDTVTRYSLMPDSTDIDGSSRRQTTSSIKYLIDQYGRFRTTEMKARH